MELRSRRGVGGVTLVGVVFQRRPTVECDVMLGFVAIGIVWVGAMRVVGRNAQTVAQGVGQVILGPAEVGVDLAEQAGE